MTSFNPALVRRDVPEFSRLVNGQRLVYLDSAATSLPPNAVIDAMSRYYQLRHANVHRSVFQTAAEATAAYEAARAAVAEFINAPGGAGEVVFTKNTTESFNLLAKSWGAAHLKAGDVVVLTEMEHHANLVPWFQLRDTLGIELRFLGVTDDYRLDLSNLDDALRGARLLSVTGMSNVLGTINPIEELARRAHAVGALIAVDGAQSVAHTPTDVTALDVDFLAFSGHKTMGPTGIGVFWARREILESMPPFLGGGGMIADVSTSGFTYTEPPARFEAGTPPIAEAVGLHAALTYLTGLGMENIEAHERGLTSMALETLTARYGSTVRVIGPGTVINRGSVISLDVENVHPHDLGQFLDEFGVCVRPGHHCAKPLMKRFGLMATARVSFGPYSLASDLDALCAGLDKALTTFGVR